MNWLNDWEKVDEYVVVILILLFGIIGSFVCGVYLYNKLYLIFVGNLLKEIIGRKEDFDFWKYFLKLFNFLLCIILIVIFLNVVVVDEIYFFIYISK